MDDMSTSPAEGRIPAITLGWRLKMSLGKVVSAQEMADHLGVSRQTLSRWMGDEGAPPARAYILQWAMRCGVDAKWLETGEVERSPNGGGSIPGDPFSPTAGNPETRYHILSAVA